LIIGEKENMQTHKIPLSTQMIEQLVTTGNLTVVVPNQGFYQLIMASAPPVEQKGKKRSSFDSKIMMDSEHE
jgi:hypothetical protein